MPAQDHSSVPAPRRVAAWLSSLMLQRGGPVLSRLAEYCRQAAQMPRRWRRRWRAQLLVTAFGVAVLVVPSLASGQDGPAAGAAPTPIVIVEPQPTGAPPEVDSTQAARPNIVVIMSDDQDPDSLWAGDGRCVPAMRNLMSFPEGSWMNFTTAHVSRSLCGPSRASFMTGQFAIHHGVIANGMYRLLDQTNTLPVWLDQAGYRTGAVGKVVWDGGWDYRNSEAATVDVQTDRALNFINNASSEPFFIWLAYHAPHMPATPPARYATTKACVAPDRPNFNEADVSDQPWWIRSTPLLDATQIAYIRSERLASQRELLAIDDGVQRVVDALKANGKLDNTMIIYTSDNGFSWGSHRHIGKTCELEECNQVPLLIRYPGLSGNPVYGDPVSNVDLTATITDYAGVTPGLPQDGFSLLPILRNPANRRDQTVFLEAPPDDRYYGIKQPNWKYVERGGGDRQLYDLRTDPYEMENITMLPEMQAIQGQLSKVLAGFLGSAPRPTATATPAQTATATPATPQTPTATPQPGSCPAPVVGNLIRNGDFEAGKTAWSFYSDVAGNSFTAGTESGYPCGNVGRVTLGATGSNIQLYQYGMAIQNGTEYRLRFRARANGNQSVGLYLQLHDKPYSDLGLSVRSVNLTPAWQTFEYAFTATGTTSSARLRIWLANSSAGSEFAFDDVVLAPAGAFGATPTNTPAPNTPTATPTATATTEPATATATPTATSEGPTETPTATPTATDDAPTATPTWTPTATAVVPTETPTATTVAPTETPTATPSQCPLPVPGDVLRNGDFEGGESGWSFYSNVSGNNFTATSEAGYPCGNTGRVDIGAAGNNVQLFQYNFPVERGTQYRLRFDARADASREIGLYLQLHKSPYTNLGLSVGSVGLTSSWQTFEYVFTATGTTSNARLRLWLSGQPAGSDFRFDNVSLAPLP